MKKYKIAVAGTGYVGLSLAVLLSLHNEVYALDVIPEKVKLINKRISTIEDKEIESFFKDKKLNLTATLIPEEAYEGADYIIIATPTDYNTEKEKFDTMSVEAVIEDIIRINPTAYIVIKSTTPIGYLASIKEKYGLSNILFSPEFLREGNALHDNLYPSRIIVGTLDMGSTHVENAEIFAQLLKQGALKENIDTLIIGATEAEAIKLFSNTYLAMRVAFFNELDTYAEMNHLNTRSVIDGVSLDPRIGGHYNNPSFGYGGYCLPKDTKQLFSNYTTDKIPNDIMKAIVDSNQTRKSYITRQILKKAGFPKKRDIIVGIYRLTMKSGSDNFRQSAIQSIIQELQEAEISVIVYEPVTEQKYILGAPVSTSLEHFKRVSDIIVANRFDNELADIKSKVYTRDLYFRD